MIPTFQELRYALRGVVKGRWYSLLSVAALALGIGACCAVFTVLYSVLLKPLPYAEPERLVVALHDGQYPVSPADYLDWKREVRSCDRLAAAQAWGATLTGGSEPELLHAMQVTGDLFPVLGVRPMLGRTVEPEDEAPGRHQVLVLSYGLWQRRFAADPGVLGRDVTVNGEPYTVVGVMPASFRFAPFWVKDAEAWSPLSLASRLNDRGGRSLRVFGRLKPGVARDAAQSELDVINRRLMAAYPATNAEVPLARLVPLHEKAVGNVRATLLVLFGTVAFVMLIACANVANLLLARASGRVRETAVHLALGASPARLAARSVMESLMIAIAGSAAGLVMAWEGLSFLLRTLPAGSLPRQAEVTLDITAVVFTLGLAILTGLLCGLAPARAIVRPDLNPSLQSGSRGSSSGRTQKRTRQFLVAAEVALAVVLLAGASLMIRSFARLRGLDPGFDPRQVITFTVAPAGRDPHLDYFARLQERLGSLPGVESASLINHLPVNGDIWTLTVTVAGRPAPPPGHEDSAVYRVVRPRYFETMRIPLRSGRDFTVSDRADTPSVAIINEAMARRHWPGESPLGRQLRIGGSETRWFTVVGVVADVTQREWTARAMPEVYLPHTQAQPTLQGAMTVVARIRGEGMENVLLREVRSLDADVPTSRPLEMRQVISDELWQSRLSMGVLGAFAGIALLLAAVGIYGIVTYVVSSQMREFGIRMALGATSTRLITGIVREGALLIGGGLAVGLTAALALAPVLASLLYGVSPRDATSFAGAPALLLLVGLAACLIPARHAARVDPSVSLRTE
jgi:putative ABC transport system permease protein